MNHTPTPWMFEVVDGMPMITHDGDAIAVRTYCFARSDDNDLEHIVKCVNAHDGLVAALEQAMKELSRIDFDWKDQMTASGKGLYQSRVNRSVSQAEKAFNVMYKTLESLKDD